MNSNVSSTLPRDRVEQNRYVQLRRLGAGIIDMIAVSYIQIWVNNIFGYIPDAKNAHEVVYGGGWGYIASAVPVVDTIWLLTCVVVYFFVQEALFSTTLGKTIVGVCVVDIHGRPISVRAALIRNVVRLVDAWPNWYIVGIIAARMSPNYQRLGDRVARTYVIAVADRPTIHVSFTFVWLRLGLISMLFAVMVGSAWGFIYTRQPVLVIQDWRTINNMYGSNPITPTPACGQVDRPFNDYVLSAPIEQYWLKDPHWGNGTVTYPIVYRLAGQEKTCDGTITLKWQGPFSERWEVVNVKVP
ncbi:RDD family protein [Dictyobacter vulcani]|nr:RDD family protein [Dictyobacter vulcani]